MPSSDPRDWPDRADDQRDLRDVNEALIAMSVRQHELIEEADLARREAESLSRELRASEERLRESERRFRTFADTAPAILRITEPDGSCSFLSRSWYEYSGQAETEALGLGWLNAVHPDDRDASWRIFLEANRQQKPFSLDYRLRRADGEYRWAIDAGRPRFDGGGQFLGYIGSVIDVHERKQAEEDLKEADRRKTEFLAMLAHELRNPLAPIRNALQVMRLTASRGRERPENEAVASVSEMMERQVGQLVRLVDDLLDVSRISRGKIELRRERSELASIIHHAVEAARSLVQCMGHDLTITLPPQPIYLSGDSARLTQVVGNLLNNACKFTDKGGRIWLTVERASRGRERPEAVIRVRDSGIGIAAHQLPRIFDMFMQIDTSLERSTSGLGIGLSLVKNLVEMHGGTVEAHSRGIGQGSEFVVRLPIPVETPTPTPEPTVSEPTPATIRRILVVDDNRDSAESLAMLLQLAGNETHTAHDGLEAVEAAATFKPDVVLLDIGLPKLNGYEAARRIREQLRRKGTVLVALTGWGQEEDRERSREAGFDGHMVKPVQYEALMKLLTEVEAG
jgi:PAS domain S-box-containing protein